MVSRLATAALVLLQVAAMAHAQGDNQGNNQGNNNNNNNDNNNFPDIAGDTTVLGATTAASTSATPSQTSTTAPATTTSDAPTSTNAFNTAYPTLAGVGVPPLIVPDTSAAPYMQHSTLPEGTVFICVGAILGFLGACVLAWRTMIAYSIRRSVRNAAKSSHGPDKSIFGLGSSEPAYTSMYATSNVSLDNLAKTKTAYGGAGGGGGAHSRSQSRNPATKPSRGPKTNSNLFFSPTANTSTPSSARHSTHLPPGYYASSASQAAGGNPLAHFGGPQSSGYGRMPSMDGLSNPPSRPVSRHAPSASATGLGGSLAPHDPAAQRRSRLGPGAPAQHSAQSSISGAGMLDTPGTQARTPSAYMEDLFSEHGYGPGERH